MISRHTILAAVFLLLLLTVGAFSLTGCSTPASTNTGSVLVPTGEQPTSTPKTETNTSTSTPASNAITVVVAGYINHGPLQPTVEAIKEVLAKYGDKVNVTWVDLATAQGQNYFKEHGLTAHMNVIINGKYEYQVNGKNVIFQWFEGQQWTKQDLDAVLENLLKE
ncbi:MAG: hypothetical protein WCA51_05785 [Dehalococcoidia bacterium]